MFELVMGLLFLIGGISGGNAGSILIGFGFLGYVFVREALWLENEKNGTNAKRREEEQKQINREYIQAVESHNSPEPWATRYATEPCPYCGHYKVRYAKWEDKRLSVSFWGSHSLAIGKNYKCEHCGKMWE